MANSTLRWLQSILLSSAFVGVVACGSTVQGGDDGGAADDDGQDDGGDGDDGLHGCTDERIDCEQGGASCIDGTWVCVEEPECPTTEPSSGSACSGDLTCTFGAGIGECDLSDRTYDCVDGTWSEPRYDRCSPPMCPETEPAPNTTCDFEGQVCEYESMVDCGPGSFSYTCEGGVWSEPSVPRCALPPCRDFTDAESCNELGCRWLEPGCGDETLPALGAAGCFDPAPCEGSCPFADEVCTETMILPDCVDEGCDACGQSEMLCVAQTGDAGG